MTLKLVPTDLPLFHRKLPRGRPKQGRRRNDKVAEIANAAIRLLAQKDFDNWSMSELAREAHCAVGSLYGRFPDK
jgi:AcrR family transcriptional regulator